jgi:hypothetical protein
MTEQRRDDRVADPAVDAAWRQGAREQPPAEVDAVILAAARAAVRSDAQERKAARAPRRSASWQPLAAAAGVIGLSFLLVQLLPRERAAPPPATPPPAAVPPSLLPPTAPATSASSDAGSPLSEEREATAGVAPRAAMETAAKQSAAPTPATPEAWAGNIAVLHDSGDLAAAAAELRAFRAAHPDADEYLPEAVRAWAASVGPEP